VRTLAGALRERCAALVAGLARAVPEWTVTRLPLGGLHLWIQLPASQADAAELAQAHGVAVSPGRGYFAAEPPARICDWALQPSPTSPSWQREHAASVPCGKSAGLELTPILLPPRFCSIAVKTTCGPGSAGPYAVTRADTFARRIAAGRRGAIPGPYRHQRQMVCPVLNPSCIKNR